MSEIEEVAPKKDITLSIIKRRGKKFENERIESLYNVYAPVIREMFKLIPSAKYAYIKNDGRIFFSPFLPEWTVDNKWLYPGATTDGFIRFTHGENAGGHPIVNLMAIGVDTTMIKQWERKHFLWKRSELLK